MRLLFTIPHFFNPQGNGKHGSLQADPQPRLEALTRCIRAIYTLHGEAQSYFKHDVGTGRLQELAANETTRSRLDIVLCVYRDLHLLDRLPFDSSCYYVKQFDSGDPILLGFGCHNVLRSNLGRYDYYCYLEDDLILHDPYLFVKLAWFNAQMGNGAVLQPNRFEVGRDRDLEKVYIEPDFECQPPPSFAHNFSEGNEIAGRFLGREIRLDRAKNPHSGCFFLNREQMALWASKDYFGDRDFWFVGPLESAASVGIMKTFRTYKPAFINANFLEIEHYGQSLSHYWRDRPQFRYDLFSQHPDNQKRSDV